MNFALTAPIHTLGDYEIRKIQGGVWHGMLAVIRTADQDILSVHGGRDSAISTMADLDCGRTKTATKTERLALLGGVPTETLTAYLATLDPFQDWKAVRDLKETLAARAA